MSYYLSVTNNIFNRKAEQVFYYHGLSVYLLKNKEEIYLFDLLGVMKETPISKIIEYIKDNNISEAEILLPDYDLPLIDKTFRYIADYLKDNDASIGLLVDSIDFIEQHKDLIEQYGITYSLSKEYVTKERSNSKVKCSQKSVLDGRDFELDICRHPSFGGDTQIIKKCAKPVQIHVKTGLDMDKPFADILIDLLNKSGKNNVDVYMKGGISRQVFSKILCNRDSVPRKDTVICLIIGLELDYDTAKQLLASAGYALSRSIVSDAVVMKYLRKGIYNLDIINDELNSRQCALLGWKPREQ